MFNIDISGIITTIINTITTRFYGFFDFLSDPFWHWLFIAIAIMAAVSAIVWFFGDYFKFLRPVGGVILLLLTFGLYSYRRGEKDQRARDIKYPPPKRKK